MTRALRSLLFVASLFTLFAFVAEAQTYVRPSKGNSFSPFSDTGLDGGWVVPGPIGISGSGTIAGPTLEWSAFDSVRVRIYTDGVGSVNGSFPPCAFVSLQYTISNLGSYIPVSYTHLTLPTKRIV